MLLAWWCQPASQPSARPQLEARKSVSQTVPLRALLVHSFTPFPRLILNVHNVRPLISSRSSGVVADDINGPAHNMHTPSYPPPHIHLFMETQTPIRKSRHSSPTSIRSINIPLNGIDSWATSSNQSHPHNTKHSSSSSNISISFR